MDSARRADILFKGNPVDRREVMGAVKSGE